MRAKWLAKLLVAHLVPRVACRKPDVIIGEPDTPYMLRWHVLPRNPVGNIYLHRFLRSDDDRALHDHPWMSMSFILDGWYIEHSIAAGGIHHAVIREAGDLTIRRAKTAHRVALHNGPCWTLFFTGPRIRQWGFHCKHGWRHWKDYVSLKDNTSSIGRGCE